MSDYKNTLNLPKTSFSMRANLAQREPEMIAFWEKIDANTAMRSASGANGTYILHDGPPYANGHIHMGTAMNKILKDIIVKSRNMQGFACSYVPGWDCHGLPIEHKVEQELKASRKELPALTVRRLCREYASKWIDIQRKEFIRLGVLGNWQDPYMSMKPEYEAAIASNLAGFVAAGSVMRACKPIYWCASCHTALAEAEVEYGDTDSPSIYVAFPMRDPAIRKVFPKADPASCKVVIWTTTPWTLPDNMAITLHPDFEYALVQTGEGQFILALDRLAECSEIFSWHDAQVLETARGQALEGLKTTHPWLERVSPVTLGLHVTLDSGTGCVHTAPGHGREDYEVGLKYGLEIYSPLDDSGRFLESVPNVAGKSVWEANPAVIDLLKEKGALLAQGKINHSYPHCWRCKNPVIFRATTQWFISMEANNLRQKALEAIDRQVRWIPAWGRERIYNMIETRPDWCISRQRQWGVPIVALKCGSCGAVWNDPAWMHEICARFATHPTGCDFWYEAPIGEIVPPGLKCPSCGSDKWQKETDILDVWFDSGSSFAAVLEARPGLHFPADLYLEGSDQHRGWFHSSLLISEGLRNQPPYKAVLTHGYVVDGNGRKMSKSLGNVIAPQELIDKFGAEILRLWASSVDYREDIRISDQILNRLVDAYRRIRNTCRFILGNLHDLGPDGLLPYDELASLDKFALHNAAQMHDRARRAYNEFEFHRIFHALHNYCVNDLSAFYFDIIKDRLYVSAPASRERRAAQTALLEILRLLLLDMAPILSFTAEEIFQKLHADLRGPEQTVFAMQDSGSERFTLPAEESSRWDFLIKARSLVNRAMEEKRAAGVIGQNLDASLTLYLSDARRHQLEEPETDLAAAFIVSQLELKALAEAPEGCFTDPEMEDMAVLVQKAPGEKCARCWTFSEQIGIDQAWPDICPRCAKVMAEISGDA